jgi:KaiC/GvpD/RAD55 family RecA-like ATPase
LPQENPVDVPLLAEFIPDGVKPGTLILVEFDPESEWLAVASTIVNGYLLAGGRAYYSASIRSPEAVKENLNALGAKVSEAIVEGRFVLVDYYSATLTGGRAEGGGSSVFEPIEGGVRVRSLKVADLSVEWLKWRKEGFQSWDLIETWPSGALGVWESMSPMLRFDEEGGFLEWLISRANPNERSAKRIFFNGVVRDVHSVAFYKRLESEYDGVIELRVMERGEEAKNFLRIRSLKGQPHDARWHEIQIKQNGLAALVK